MRKKEKIIYLDYAATTPLDARVLKAMQPYFSEKFANPSSLHESGQEAKSAIKEAREKVASVLGCRSDEIIFTSSGTEADNLALKGVSEARGHKGHIIVSQIEHKAILESARYLENRGVAVSYVGVNEYGRVDLNDVARAIRADTFLISIMYANNEIGTIQNISEIGNLVRKRGILMHSDAVQAPGLLPLDVNKLHVDLLSLSSHKFYGPKGAGILYARRGVEIAPQMHGGGQERGLRSSTENVAGIAGCAEALLRAEENREKASRRLSELRDWLVKKIRQNIPHTALTGHPKNRLPNNASFCFEGIEGESLVMRLSERGFCASSGSACSSGGIRSSHVLSACGITEEISKGSLRISLGKTAKKKDLELFVKILSEEINKLSR